MIQSEREYCPCENPKGRSLCTDCEADQKLNEERKTNEHKK